MTERFVRGWSASLRELRAVVGSRGLTGRVLLEGKDEEVTRDLVRTLGRGNLEAGRRILEESLDDVLEGRLDASKAYEYLRVLEVVVDHLGRPLTQSTMTTVQTRMRDGRVLAGRMLTPEARASWIWLQWTNYLPNGTLGRWNPILAELELPALAELWAEPNFPFPWQTQDPSREVDWPICTAIDGGDLERVAAELGRLHEARIEALAPSLLAATADERNVGGARRELWTGLQLLRRWIGSVRDQAGRALLLVMDGDQ